MRKPELKERARISAMPVLPVFFRLEGRRVLLAGGDEAAAWKAELLAAAGAIVHVAARYPCNELRLVAESAPHQLELSPRPWRADDFENAALAIGAFNDELEASAFVAAARKRKVPVNIVDKPDLCDFQFGSIVNRAPAVVAISTNGAAPALGQAIRRRIETLLPQSIADWAQAAKSLRPKLSTLLPNLKAREDFWRHFAEKAFTAPVSEIEESVQKLLARESASAGKVTLVGAGPGDAEYLTLKALRALQSADIILFDDLVSDEVLDLARREAKRMLVGKRGGRASCRQDDINETILRLARQGKNVVRLKSGDPMIFGRAGEEIEMLEAAGVEVDIAPGVTAALAAAARLKISLTHRDCAQGVKFITAHSKNGALQEIDWRAAADPDITLMIYMGARKAPEFAKRLISEGLDPTTPAIVGAAISRPQERFHALTLDALAEAEFVPSYPVLIGVGQVFRQAASRIREQDIPSEPTKAALFY